MKIVGSLRPGATAQGAQAEFTLLGKQLSSQHPERNPVAPRLTPLAQYVSAAVRPALFVLTCAVGVVMLIVCANLSNLQLARLGARQKEMAMRAALGADRSRLLRQVFTENVALSCCGAVLGLVLAMAGTHELARLHAFNLPLLESVRIDGSALLFALLAAVASGVLFGILPALRVTAFSLREGMQDGSRGTIGGKRHAWVREGLVVSELAFACILLVGAGLLMRSFLRVLDVNLGFQPERAAALRIDPSFRISSSAQQNSFIDDALNRARAVPGIVAAGITDVLPLRDDRSWSVSCVGEVYEKGRQPEPFIRVVSDGYFEAAGIPLRLGREFTPREIARRASVSMVINETLGADALSGPEPARADDHGKSWTDGPRRSRGRSRRRPSRSSGKGWWAGNLPTDAANRGLRRHATGCANRASTGQSGGRNSNCSAADRPQSPSPRVCDVSGSSRQSDFAAAVSGALASRIRGFRLDTRLARDLCRDFLFGKSAGPRNWNSNGAGSIRDWPAGPHSSPYAWIVCPGAGAGDGSVASPDERAGKPAVWRYSGRSGHICWDGNAVDCGGCPRRIFSSS